MDKKTKEQLDALNEEYEFGLLWVEGIETPLVFATERIKDEDVPEGMFRYSIRHSDYDDSVPATLEKSVVVNFYGHALSFNEIDFGEEGYLPVYEWGLSEYGDGEDFWD